MSSLRNTADYDDLLTEVCRIVVLRARQTHGLQEGHHVGAAPLVHAVPSGHDVHVVEHLEHGGAGLVYGADDGSSSSRQALQQCHDLYCALAVQASEPKQSHL